jgi:hypothetical protein
MSWTYSGRPGTTNQSSRIDAVRHLIGDTDQSDQQIQNEEIIFALSQGSDDVYAAAAISARAIAARYGRLVDTAVDQTGISAKYSQRQKTYHDLSTELEKQSRKYGSVGLGMPDAGGLSLSEIRSVEEDPDRVPSMFTVNELLVESRDDTRDW